MATSVKKRTRQKRQSPFKLAEEYCTCAIDRDGFEVKFISKAIGKGMFTTKAIAQGSFLVEYRGTHSLATDDDPENTYLLYYRHNGAEYKVDATDPLSCIARYINDDWINPNAVMKKTVFNGKVHMCLFALCDIPKGKEIRYDYGVDDLPWRKESVAHVHAKTEHHLPTTMLLPIKQKQQQENGQLLIEIEQLQLSNSPIPIEQQHLHKNGQLPTETEQVQLSNSPLPIEQQQLHENCQLLTETEQVQLSNSSLPIEQQQLHENGQLPTETEQVQLSNSPLPIEQQQLQQNGQLPTETEQLQLSNSPLPIEQQQLQENGQFPTETEQLQLSNSPLPIEQQQLQQNGQLPTETEQLQLSNSPLSIEQQQLQENGQLSTETEQLQVVKMSLLTETETLQLDEQIYQELQGVHLNFLHRLRKNRNGLQVTLEGLNYHLKNFLAIGSAVSYIDSTRCIAILETLERAMIPKLLVFLLDKNTDLIQTVKKILKYKSSDEICDAACRLFTKMKQMTITITRNSFEDATSQKENNTYSNKEEESDMKDQEDKGKSAESMCTSPAILLPSRLPQLPNTASIEQKYNPYSNEEAESDMEDDNEEDSLWEPEEDEVSDDNLSCVSESTSSRCSSPVIPLPSRVSHLLSNTASIEQRLKQDETATSSELRRKDTLKQDETATSSELRHEDMSTYEFHCNSLPEDAVITEKKYPDIYVRKIIKSKKTKAGKKKKTNRVQNSVHACLFCGVLLQHIQSHVLAKHPKESAVKKIKSKLQQSSSKKRNDKKIIDTNILRSRGDDKHNMIVKTRKKGELLLYRRPKETFDIEEFGPCPSCKEWMLKDSLMKHNKTCPARKLEKSLKETKRSILLQTEILLGNIVEGSERLKKEVYPIMTRDNITAVAQGDRIICVLGESWLKRSIGNKLKRKYYVSQHMRQAARLLKAVQKRTATKLSMWEYLRPSHSDSIAEASLDISMRSLDNEDLQSPSNAIHIRYDLKRMAHAKKSIAVKEFDKDRVNGMTWRNARDEAKEFLQDLDENFDEKVTKLARNILQERMVNKVDELPNPKDIEKLSKHMVDELQNMDVSTDDVTWVKYKYAVTYLQARLMTYNERRSGELEAVLLKSYHGRKGIADIDKELMGELTESEKYMLESQELVETRGKRGRRVPILVPPECAKPLSFISNPEVRKSAEIRADNKYLFANSDDAVIRSYTSLKFVTAKCNLSAPERLNSVNMRKYMANLSQALALNEIQLDWVYRHLGHSQSVHLQHYRSMSGFIERVHVGKILLMQDLNVSKHFIGKTLEEVDFNAIIKSTPSCASVQPMEEEEAQPVGEVAQPLEDVEEDEPVKKMRKISRISWSEEELDELYEQFPNHFENKIVPRKEHVLQAIVKSRRNAGLIYKRSWTVIKSKVAWIIKHPKKHL